MKPTSIIISGQFNPAQFEIAYNTAIKSLQGMANIKPIKIMTQLDPVALSKAEQQIINFQKNMQIRMNAIKGSPNAKFGNMAGLSNLETQMKSLSANNPNFQQSMTSIGTGVKKISSEMDTAARKSLNLGNAFHEVFIKGTVWLVGLGMLFSLIDMFKQGITGMETGMAGLKTVLPELATNQKLYNEASRDAIGLMQKYGASLDDVMTSAKSFGRMYKDLNTIMALTHNAILMNVVDNVTLDEAVKGNEATLAIYGKGLTTNNEVMALSNHVMDTWTKLAHNTLASATDLIAMTQRSAGAAATAKVSFEELMGVGSAAIRQTGLPGANIGNMLKTVFSNLAVPTEKVENSLNAIGVSMRDNNGKLRDAYDIMLDLSLKTKDATLNEEELNNAVLKAANGKMQYSKFAAVMGGFNDIVKNTAMSINNQGVTLAIAGEQLDTIQRKFGMLKGTIVGTFSEAGDGGLRSTLKGLIDVINQFLMGLNKVNPVAINLALLAGVAKLAWGQVANIFTKMTVLFPAKIAETNADTAAIELNTIANTENAASLLAAETATIGETGALIAEGEAALVATEGTAAFATTAALATAGITVAIGLLVLWISHLGKAKLAQQNLAQATQDDIVINQQKVSQDGQTITFLDKMDKKHKQLTDKLSTLTKGTKEYNDIASNRDAVEKAVGLAVDDSIKKDVLKQNSWDKEIKKAKELTLALQEAEIKRIAADNELTKISIENSNGRIRQLQNEYNATKILASKEEKKNPGSNDSTTAIRFGNKVIGHLPWKLFSTPAEKVKQELLDEQAKNQKLNKDLTDTNNVLAAYYGDPNATGVPDGPGGDSGSGSTASKAEASAIEYEDLSKELIKAYNKQVDIDKIQSSSLEKQIKTATSAKDYAKEVSLTNQLLTNQKKTVDDLNAANAKIHSEADIVRSKTKYDTESWFDVNGEASVAYKTALNQFAGATDDASKAAQKDIKDTFDSLYALKKAWIDNTSAIDAMGDSIDSNKQKIQQLVDDAKTKLEKNADDIVALYKDVYEQEKKVAEKAIQAQEDADEIRHKAVTDNLDNELSKYEDIIAAKLKLIESDATEADYNKELTKMQKERQDIQDKIATYSLDNSDEGRAKVIDLNTQLSDKNEEIADKESKHTTDLRKDNLNDLLDAYKKDNATKKKTEDSNYEATKTSYDKQKEVSDAYYDDLIADETHWASVKTEIMNSTLTNVQNSFQTFKSFILANLSAIGGSIGTNLISKMEKVVDLTSGSIGELASVTNGGTSSSSTSTSKAIATISSGSYENVNGTAIMSSRSLSALLGLGSDVGWNDGQVHIGNKWFTPTKNENGTTYVGIREVAEAFGHTVKYNNGEIDIYHEGGIVGEKTSTPSYLTKIANKLFNTNADEQAIIALKNEVYSPEKNMSKFLFPNLGKLMSSIPSSVAATTNVSLNVYVDNMNTNSKKDTDKVFSEMVNGIRKII